MKDDNEVIAEFNEYVNVTASELDQWLNSDDSSKAGWHKDGGDGESVGQGSGHKIVEILKSNPDKDPEKYTEDQIQHMRKVASYCKRHLAQESKGLKEKDPDEVKKTKSYISLMNWGHDPLKASGRKGLRSGESAKKSDSKKQNVEVSEPEQVEVEEEAEQSGEEAEESDKKAGDKRKQSIQQSGTNKKREIRKGGSTGGDTTKEEEKVVKEGKNGEADQDDGDYEVDDDNEDAGDKPSAEGPKKGETVSWKWGSGHPQGKVLDVKEGDATITTKRGNKVSRKGKPEDPAVILDAGRSKAIKLAHELD